MTRRSHPAHRDHRDHRDHPAHPDHPRAAHRAPLTALATALVTALASALVLATAGSSPATPTTASATMTAPVRLMADLEASGDANGSGHAMLTLNKARKKVCATVTWSAIAKPNAAHIHRASDGSIVVDLSGSVTGGANCAKGVSKRKIQRILNHPRRYYFNVHNTPYPAGAIQGDLHR